MVSRCDLDKKTDRTLQKLKMRCADWFQDQASDWTEGKLWFYVAILRRNGSNFAKIKNTAR